MIIVQVYCAFTGHRPKSFPWKYDETARDCILLKAALAAQITELTTQGVTDYLSGMALGVDLWSAQIVLNLRRKNPEIKLHCILPCEGQEVKWAAPAQEQYHTILSQASDIVYVSQEYTSNCMLRRNHYLVEHSSILLAIYNGARRSGTGATINYARKLGRKIIIIDPITQSVTQEGGER